MPRQARSLIAEEERAKRVVNGSKGGKGSKSRRRKAGANKSQLLPDPPPVRDRYAALSAQRRVRERQKEGSRGREAVRQRGRETETETKIKRERVRASLVSTAVCEKGVC